MQSWICSKTIKLWFKVNPEQNQVSLSWFGRNHKKRGCRWKGSMYDPSVIENEWTRTKYVLLIKSCYSFLIRPLTFDKISQWNWRLLFKQMKNQRDDFFNLLWPSKKTWPLIWHWQIWLTGCLLLLILIIGDLKKIGH